VGENDKLLGRGETVEYLDTTASGSPQRAVQVIGGFDGNAVFEDRRA
jgi:hypothetical protein